VLEQAAAAAASSTALAEALLSKTRRGGSGSGSGSAPNTPTDDGSKRLHPSSWTETRDSVNTSIGLADSYTEMILVRCLLLSTTEPAACLLASSCRAAWSNASM